METSDEVGNSTKPEIAAKRKKRLRLKRLRRKSKARAYEFTGGGKDVVGVVYLEIQRITDLPPERNSMLNNVFFYRLKLTCWYFSDKNIFRHGSIRSSLSGS